MQHLPPENARLRLTRFWRNKLVRRIVLAATIVISLVAGYAMWTIYMEAQAHERWLVERRRLDQELSAPRVWPVYANSALEGATAALTTACRINTTGYSGRFFYQLALSSAESLLSAPTRRDFQSRQSGDGSEIAEQEWQTFLQRRQRLYREMAGRLGFLTPAITIQFFDKDGFTLRTVQVPTEAVQIQTDASSNPTALIANSMDVASCGDEVLRFASWSVNVLVP